MRLADALIVMDSQLVIRVENVVTTSSLEVLGAGLNGTMSKCLRLVLLILLPLLLTDANEATYSIEFGSNFSLR